MTVLVEEQNARKALKGIGPNSLQIKTLEHVDTQVRPYKRAVKVARPGGRAGGAEPVCSPKFGDLPWPI